MSRLSRTTPVPKIGIVHLGPGAFFRAFNAVYTAQAMAASGGGVDCGGDGDWGITAVSLRSSAARDQLVPQGCVFTSVTMGAEGEICETIDAITDVMVAPEDPDAVITTMAGENVKIVSLTITEKGYCHAPSTGRLNLDDPDIQHDLAHIDKPRTAVGFIVAALARRRDKGLKPFTVLSCDNLPANGVLARHVVLEFARCVDADLADWIADQVTFPATMVDRITPATTADDLAKVARLTGFEDAAAVFHEPFRQWVIEDDFANGRPAWDQVGAQLVRDVDAFETMKLRCLNGTHSALAYLGYLAGHETISETVADPVFARLCGHLWTHEILPTVPPPEGEDLTAYVRALLKRYRNPAIRHRTWQIAMDGSQKLPQRILGTVWDNLEAGRDISGLALVVAGWMRYVSGVDEQGGAIDVRDPLKDRLRAATETDDPVAALLGLDVVFAPELVSNAHFRDAVHAAHVRLATHGARVAIEQMLGEST